MYNTDMTNNDTKDKAMNEVAAAVKNVVNKLNISSESFAIQLTIINKLSKAGLEISQENIDKIQEMVDN